MIDHKQTIEESLSNLHNAIITYSKRGSKWHNSKQAKQDSYKIILQSIREIIGTYQYQTITYSHIIDLMADSQLSTRTKQRLTKSIIESLVNDKFLRPSETFRENYTFQKNNLFCYDFNSYGVLMDRYRKYGQACITNNPLSIAKKTQLTKRKVFEVLQ